MLYNSLCLPYMLYCCEIWGRASGYLLNEITLLQKKFIRMVHRACYLEHTQPLFKLSFILTFPDLLEYAMAILIFKVFYNLLPINIQFFFQIHINIRLWNALPDDITNISSIHLFKRHIKSSYLHCY